MTLTEVRVRARPASTRRRIVAWSRAAVARVPSSSPSRLAWCSAASTNAATTRSQVGSATSSAKARRAGPSRSRSSRAASVATSRRIGSGATGAVAAMACSRPAAPAIVSRSISAHPATASTRAIVAVCAFDSVNRPGMPQQAAAASSAATGQPVPAPTSDRAPTAIAEAEGATFDADADRPCPSDVAASTPRMPRAMRATPRPAPAPSRTPRAVTISTHSVPTSRRAARAVRGRSRPRRARRGSRCAGAPRDGPTVGAGAEDLVRDHHRPFGVDDLAHRGHEASPGRVLRQEDDEVDGVGDEQVRRFEREALGGLHRVGGELGERALRAGRVQGRHRAVGALGHRVEEREDLLATGLADDHPVGRESQRPAHEIGQADAALAFEVRLAGFERDDVGVQLGVAVETELEGVFDRDEPLPWRDVGRHGAEQRRLSSADAAADDDRLAGEHQASGRTPAAPGRGCPSRRGRRA